MKKVYLLVLLLILSGCGPEESLVNDNVTIPGDTITSAILIKPTSYKIICPVMAKSYCNIIVHIPVVKFSPETLVDYQLMDIVGYETMHYSQVDIRPSGVNDEYCKVQYDCTGEVMTFKANW